MRTEARPEKSTPPTICWVIRGDEDYGVRRSSRTLLEALRTRRFGVVVVSLSEGSFVDECETAGFQVRRLQLPELPSRLGLGLVGRVRRRAAYLAQLTRFRGTVAEALRDVDPDLVHVRKSGLVGYAAYGAKKAGIRCLWHMPDVVDGSRGFGLHRMVFQIVCRLYGVQPVGNSQYTARRFGRWPVQAEVLHLGVDAGYFHPENSDATARSCLGIPDDAVVVIAVGRLVPPKGQDRLVEALARSEAAATCHLVLVGGDLEEDYGRYVRRLVAESGLSKRCHFVGRVADPRPYYRMADFVANSRVDAEPFGLAVIEAMMMERPVLALALGGPAETVLDGRTGWHVKDPSANGWAEGLERALADRGRWDSMGRRAREWAVAEFSTETFAQNYLTLIERILKARS